MENLVTQLLSSYYGRRIIVTGDNGFKGSWLVALLNQLGAEVYGISLEITKDSAFKNFHSQGSHRSNVQDIRDLESLRTLVTNIKPDLVFHLAAQALVLESYANPLVTFEINVQGTANLLDAVLRTACRGVVVATTDKVYQNDNSGAVFKESDVLWGHDPYSLSKTGTELVISAWRNLPIATECKLVTVRAGNVYGPGDRARNRLFPDLLAGLRNGEKTIIRNPDSVRPWQYVLDPLIGYLLVGLRILNLQGVSNSYNFGPSQESFISVKEFVAKVNEYAPIEIQFQDEISFLESKILKLDSTLALTELGWDSITDLGEGIAQTIQIDSSLHDPKSIVSHVEEYISKFKNF